MVICKNNVYKKILIMFSILLICAIYFFSTSQNEKIVYLNTSKAYMQGTINENLKKSDAIIMGRIIDAKTYDTNGIPFTDYSLEIEKTYKTNKDIGNIVVSMTGGKINDTRYLVEGSKMLNVGDKYILFLVKRFPDDLNSNQYCPLYGDIGIVKVNLDINENIKENKNKYIAEKFNPNNNLESTFIGKDIDKEITSILK